MMRWVLVLVVLLAQPVQAEINCLYFTSPLLNYLCEQENRIEKAEEAHNDLVNKHNAFLGLHADLQARFEKQSKNIQRLEQRVKALESQR